MAHGWELMVSAKLSSPVNPCQVGSGQLWQTRAQQVFEPSHSVLHWGFHDFQVGVTASIKQRTRKFEITNSKYPLHGTVAIEPPFEFGWQCWWPGSRRWDLESGNPVEDVLPKPTCFLTLSTFPGCFQWHHLLFHAKLAKVVGKLGKVSFASINLHQCWKSSPGAPTCSEMSQDDLGSSNAFELSQTTDHLKPSRVVDHIQEAIGDSSSVLGEHGVGQHVPVELIAVGQPNRLWTPTTNALAASITAHQSSSSDCFWSGVLSPQDSLHSWACGVPKVHM